MSGNIVSAKIKSGASIVDVRSPDEFADGFYPGARNIPVSQLANRLADVGPRDKPIVVYCASGGRSAVAQQILKSAGFTDVTNAGGIGNMPQT